MSDAPSLEIAELAARDWGRRTAPSPVSAWAIRAWCAAIGVDPSRFISGSDGAAVAPPPMLQCWAGAGLHAEHMNNPTLHVRVRAAFNRAGFTAVVATNYEQAYLGDLRPGDVIEELSRVEAVSPLKQTALGAGHFVTILFRFSNQHGAAVGTLRVRTLYFNPSGDGASRERAAMAPNGATIDPTPLAPPPAAVIIPVTRTMVIAGSIASNDFEAVHHDGDIARQQGLADIILSIVTTSGLVARYALEAVGPRAVLRQLSLRLGAAAVPGDVLSMTGQWLSSDRNQLGIAGQVSRGLHVQASVTTQPPAVA